MDKYRVTYKYYTENSGIRSGTHTSAIVNASSSAEAKAKIKSKPNHYRVEFIRVEKL